VGRPLAGLDVETSPLNAFLQIDQQADLEHVRTSSAVVPAFLTGRLTGPDARNITDMAVVIDGRVAATAKAYVTDHVRVTSVSLPESVLVDGRNYVDFYAVRGTGDKLTLTPVPGSSRR
jgi:hypothetical protein